MSAHSFKDLKVWQEAMILVEQTYLITKQLPDFERFALADQLRRSAVSIPSNIAEGQKRYGDAETIHFCSIAQGSVAELETQLLLAQKIYKIPVKPILDKAESVSKMLSGLIKALKARKNPGAPSPQPRA